MQGLRKCSSLDVVEYMGDPVLQPIRSFENATLVRALHHLSCGLNDRVYIVPYTTKFSLAKIFAKGSYFVLGQYFRQI